MKTRIIFIFLITLVSCNEKNEKAEINKMNSMYCGETLLKMIEDKAPTNLSEIIEKDKANCLVSYNKSEMPILIYFTYLGKKDVVENLLSLGADIHATYVGRKTTALDIAVERGLVDMVDLLLKHGADINLPTYEGLTPLMRATRRGNIEMMRHLLTKKADINKISDETALHVSLFQLQRYDHYEPFKFLLENNANPDIKNNRGKSVNDIIREEHLSKAIQIINKVREEKTSLKSPPENLSSVKSSSDSAKP